MATIEDYICEHLARPLRLKDGSQVLNDDGKPVTKEEGIAMNVVNRFTGKVNTDHRYLCVRFYFEYDDIWTTKIKSYT